MRRPANNDCLRLFDYGRPRELHLADGAAVAAAKPMPADLRQCVDLDVSARLLDSHHLGVAYVASGDLALLGEVPQGAMIAPLRGEVTVERLSARAGECLWTAETGAIEASTDARLLVGWHKD